MFVEHSASEVMGLGFEGGTVDLGCGFPFWWSAIVAPEGMQ